MPPRIHVSDSGEFVDSDGNQIQLRGVNLDPNVKYPITPHCRSHDPMTPSFFEDAHKVSFISHPLKLDDIELHILKLKSLGYNAIRYPFTWESIEHEGPGKYDFEFIDYTIEVLKKIHSLGGIYVYLDPHQDVWSRFTGGSGAPLWTLYCAGFQPRRFEQTQAAIIQNSFIDPRTGKESKPYPKMLWATNYSRLAAQTMFTLFFGGKKFAPKCAINGLNIEDYLQDRFTEAVMTFYRRIRANAPELFEDHCVIGLETMNEPNMGYFTDPNLSEVPKDRKLKRGTMPTAFQAFQLGEGLPALVDTYEISVFGPRKTDTTRIDPKGQSAWLSEDERAEVDAQYNWQRGEEWKAATCIWRLHGVWELKKGNQPVLLKADYFAREPMTGARIDLRYFTNGFFLDYFQKFRGKFREQDTESYIFMQSLTLQEPPRLKNTDLIDDKTIYACHFYDGMSLMFKSWNKLYNVDTLGIMRDKYANPVLSVVLGETMIRKCIRKQLAQMKEEGKKLLGSRVPVFFTEIGMPFDMDNKKAYENGDFSSQIGAMDALGYALEGSNLSYSLWCYCTDNSHEWGDSWNNEDFSIWSKDDLIDHSSSTPTDLKSDSEPDLVSSFSTIPHGRVSDIDTEEEESHWDYNGVRALEAILRPYPVKISGEFENAEFDLTRREYRLTINAKSRENGRLASTLIFLPQMHFPIGQTTIKTTSGQFLYDPNQQVLRWSHDLGLQSISLRKEAETSKKSDDPEGCSVM
ncbi:LANO_0H20120g1_1 [Lachancea nothofagi CBS 11611]|uniref:LANO_0H20120g1_1 n=1 Tax=Lachancea nothofagi CBS 11611 TaxID=1266666 RepID=A0A1G4KNK1_9SACH|nr:LANO_0H20120g1_1 [Lachancea nothofagi CBS 11611]